MKQVISDRLNAYIGGRSCDIWGLGVSNLPLAEQLCEAGISLTVRDQKQPEELGEKAMSLEKKGVRFVSGKDCFATSESLVIFRSPGIRPDLPAIKSALLRGAELTSEIELFLSLTEAETFAITGSDGKTTSTTLTGRFLSDEAERIQKGRVFVGGNIGTPLLDRIGEIGKRDRAVMELSSFQLMTVRKAPRYSAITNLSPNHLDWHGSMEEYVAAKGNIIGENTERFVTNADCPTTASLAEELIRSRKAGGKAVPAVYLFSSTRSSFSALFPEGAGDADRAVYKKDGVIVISDGHTERPLLSIDRIRVPGRHNVENFMTAIALTDGRVDPSVYGSVADRFFGVEHRLEWVRSFRGVDYYNSSIDSSPTRTAAALSALAGRDIVIICGGYDKKIPFEPLAESLCRHVRAVVLTGATAEKIGAVLKAHPDYREGSPEMVFRPDFEEAVHAAKELSRQGGCVLLSPACASFDAFRNFAERGNKFREIVKRLEN